MAVNRNRHVAKIVVTPTINSNRFSCRTRPRFRTGRAPRKGSQQAGMDSMGLENTPDPFFFILRGIPVDQVPKEQECSAARYGEHPAIPSINSRSSFMGGTTP